MDGTFFPSRMCSLVGVLLGLAVLAAACAADDSSTPDSAAATTEAIATTSSALEASGPPSLVIGQLPDFLRHMSGAFSKYVNVWGVHIVASPATEDPKVLHAANVMAQYLDNDADGTPDNEAVIDALVSSRALLIMGSTFDEFEDLDWDILDGYSVQDLYGDETARVDGFDSSLEEVHHLLWRFGWAEVFPEQLLDEKGSAIADAMDIARGGQFDTIPDPYPEGAWYTYYAETCDYRCMIAEYIYWAHTSLMGGQEGRAGEIGEEWRLETAEKVRLIDTAATAILEDSTLGLPTALPDGNYQS